MESPPLTYPPAPDDAATARDRRSCDRRRRRSFVLRERRTGFDRRDLPVDADVSLRAIHRLVARTLLRLRDQPLLLLSLLVVMNVLSLVDFALTLKALEQGATELNPVIKPLLDVSPWLAGVVKVLLVGSASLLIWRFRRFKMILQVALIGPLFFALINLYQVTFGFLL